MLYNAALRQDENDAIYRELKKAGNMFSNTIYALVSAVVKLQRKSDLPTGLVLYRYSTLLYPTVFYACDVTTGCAGAWGALCCRNTTTRA
jgi:hypothetical protein